MSRDDFGNFCQIFRSRVNVEIYNESSVFNVALEIVSLILINSLTLNHKIAFLTPKENFLQFYINNPKSTFMPYLRNLLG